MKYPVSEGVASLDPFLATGAGSQYIGVHPNTLRRYVKDGLIKPDGSTPSGEFRFRRSTLDRLLEGGCGEGRDCEVA